MIVQLIFCDKILKSYVLMHIKIFKNFFSLFLRNLFMTQLEIKKPLLSMPANIVVELPHGKRCNAAYTHIV